MSLPFESFSAQTLTGVVDGAVHDLEQAVQWHSAQFEFSGVVGTGSVEVVLEVSLDGTNFLNLGSSVISLSGPAVAYVRTGLSTPFPARYVRASVDYWSGLTSCVLTAWVASA